MRDRIKDWQSEPVAMQPDAIQNVVDFEQTVINDAKGDALNALVSLGYSQSQADKAIKAVFSQDKSSEDLIRDALKSML